MIRITCNGKTVEVLGTFEIKIDPKSIGTTIIGGNDLYDLGFTHADIHNNDVVFEIEAGKIVLQSESTTQKRLVTALATECKVPESVARRILERANWHYGNAVFWFKAERSSGPGEIVLSDSHGICNLGSDFNQVVKTCTCASPLWEDGKCGDCGKPLSLDQYQSQRRDNKPGVIIDISEDPEAVLAVLKAKRRIAEVNATFAENYGSEVTNPCTEVESRGLQMECICAIAGKAHCRACQPNLDLGVGQ